MVRLLVAIVGVHNMKPIYTKFLKNVKEISHPLLKDRRFDSIDDVLIEFRYICKQYGCKLYIRQKGGLSFYNKVEKSIHLDISKYNKSKKIRSFNSLTRLFCHELAHHIQHMDKSNWVKSDSLYELALLEWEAESLAYHLTKKYYGHRLKNIHHKQFNWCRTREDMEVLREYYNL